MSVGVKYKLTVYEGVLAWTHKMGYTIEGIFLPEDKIAMNKIAVFETDEGRYKNALKLEEVEVDDRDVEALRDYISREKHVKGIAGKYLGLPQEGG